MNLGAPAPTPAIKAGMIRLELMLGVVLARLTAIDAEPGRGSGARDG